jgi:hypothetical protein
MGILGVCSSSVPMPWAVDRGRESGWSARSVSEDERGDEELLVCHVMCYLR